MEHTRREKGGALGGLVPLRHPSALSKGYSLVTAHQQLSASGTFESDAEATELQGLGGTAPLDERAGRSQKACCWLAKRGFAGALLGEEPFSFPLTDRPGP